MKTKIKIALTLCLVLSAFLTLSLDRSKSFDTQSGWERYQFRLLSRFPVWTYYRPSRIANFANTKLDPVGSSFKFVSSSSIWAAEHSFEMESTTAMLNNACDIFLMEPRDSITFQAVKNLLLAIDGGHYQYHRISDGGNEFVVYGQRDSVLWSYICRGGK